MDDLRSRIEFYQDQLEQGIYHNPYKVQEDLDSLSSDADDEDDEDDAISDEIRKIVSTFFTM